MSSETKIVFKNNKAKENIKYDMSVIMTCHNAENKIRPMLLSLELQDLGKYTAEYIFVIDSCIDNTLDVIYKYFDLNKFPLTIIQTNVKSPGGARDVGRKYVNGVYTWMIDCDDWLLSKVAISDCLDILYANNDPVLFVRNATNFDDWIRKYIGEDIKHVHDGTVWAYIFKTDFIAEFSFVTDQIGEDGKFVRLVKDKISQLLPNFNMQTTNNTLYFYEQFSADSQCNKKGLSTRAEIEQWRADIYYKSLEKSNE